MIKRLIELQKELACMETALKLWYKTEGNDALFAQQVEMHATALSNLTRLDRHPNIAEAHEVFCKAEFGVKREQINELYRTTSGLLDIL